MNFYIMEEVMTAYLEGDIRDGSVSPDEMR